MLLLYAEEYMEGMMEGACVLAAHRRSNMVEIKDVQTHLGQLLIYYLRKLGVGL